MAITVQPTKLVNTTPVLTLGSPQVTSYVDNSFSTDTVGGVQFPLQKGVPMQPQYMYTVIPAAKNDGCICANIPSTTSGFLQLNTSSSVNGSGNVKNAATVIAYSGQAITIPPYLVSGVQVFPGVTGFTGSNQTCLQLDCERNICFYFEGGPPTDLCYITIGGWDYRGVAVAEILTVDPDDIVANLIGSLKSYSILGFIYLNTPTGIAFQVGNDVTIGLPYYLINTQFMYLFTYNDIQYFQQDASGFITEGNTWRAGTEFPSLAPSLTSDPARGSIGCPVSEGFDGQTSLTIAYFVYGADSETNANIQNLNPSALFTYSIQTNQATPAQYVWPYLVEQDLVGMQYPGDYPIYQTYANTVAQT